MQSSPASCYFLPLMTKCSPWCPVLKHRQSVFLPRHGEELELQDMHTASHWTHFTIAQSVLCLMHATCPPPLPLLSALKQAMTSFHFLLNP